MSTPTNVIPFRKDLPPNIKRRPLVGNRRPLVCRAGEEFERALDQLARQTRVTRSDLIRHFVRKGLKESGVDVDTYRVPREA